MSSYIFDVITSSVDFKYQLSKVLVNKKTRDSLNIPIEEEIKLYEERWHSYGTKIFSIPSLCEENPILHTQYLNLVKGSYFYYKNLNTELSGNDYKNEKYRVMYEIIQWARKHYYDGNKKISDIIYDNMKQNMVLRTQINADSKIARINHNLNDVQYTCQTHSLDLWNECGELMYRLDILKKENPELHDRYINIRKKAYHYFMELPMNEEDRGFKGRIKYQNDKYDILGDVLKWARDNYYSGRPSFSDSQYDYLKQNRIIRNDINTRSVNINDC